MQQRLGLKDPDARRLVCPNCRTEFGVAAATAGPKRQLARPPSGAKPEAVSAASGGGINQHLLITGSIVAGGLLVAGLAITIYLLTRPTESKVASKIATAESTVSSRPSPPAKPVYRPLSEGNTVELYEDPPPPANPNLTTAQYDVLVAGVVDERAVQIKSVDNLVFLGTV